MDEKIKEIIELAISANGGENHRKDWCHCDPSVGYTPCEYCAIFNGLNKAKILLSRIKELEEGFEMMKFGWNEEAIKLGKAEGKIKQLVEGIEKHCQKFSDPLLDYPEWVDKELYELIEGKLKV